MCAGTAAVASPLPLGEGQGEGGLDGRGGAGGGSINPSANRSSVEKTWPGPIQGEHDRLTQASAALRPYAGTLPHA